MSLINKRKEIKVIYFLSKIVIFLLILFLLDFAIGSLLRYFYFKQDSGLLYRTSYSLDSTRAEFVIFGSSTANHHYDSQIFEKRLHTSVYNSGRDGNTIFFNYAIFQSILKRYRPKIAILDLNVGEFKLRQVSYDRLSSLLPYYKNHPELRPIIQLKSPYEKYKLLSRIYPFNSMIFTIGIGNTAYNKTRNQINDDKGYVPLNRVWNKEISFDTSSTDYRLDSNKINIFKSFVMECIGNKIKLYIIISPRFIEYNNDPSIEAVRNIANEFNQPFYDFSKDTLFWKHREYFADKDHLNNKGADVFSNEVIDKILQNESKINPNNEYHLSAKNIEK